MHCAPCGDASRLIVSSTGSVLNFVPDSSHVQLEAYGRHRATTTLRLGKIKKYLIVMNQVKTVAL